MSVLASLPTVPLLGQAATPVVTSAAATPALPIPDIAWAALLPLIILSLGAVLLLTFSSLWRRPLPNGTYAVYTSVVGLAAMMRSSHVDACRAGTTSGGGASTPLRPLLHHRLRWAPAAPRAGPRHGFSLGSRS
jgi:hypothetical protein